MTTTATATEPNQATQPQPAAAPIEARNGFWWGTGRRKTAVARVRIRPGKGHYLINGRTVDAYFTEPQYRNDAMAPLKAAEMVGKMDVYVKMHGGGTTGQAGAVMVGLARALKAYDTQFEAALREGGYLTIDDRQVERKKYGQSGARRRFQFSKR